MRKLVISLLCVLALPVARAATFIVRSDTDMVREANAILVGTALESKTEPTRQGGFQTVTLFSVDESIKGLAGQAVIRVAEPGGVIGSVAAIIPGSPRFADGEQVLLFLTRDGQGEFTTLDLTLGRFTFAKDVLGRRVLIREEAEVVGWDPDGNVHQERRRSHDQFLVFVREVAKGHSPQADYFIDRAPLTTTLITAEGAITAQFNAGGFSPSKYTSQFTFDPDGGGVEPIQTHGTRWPAPDGVFLWRNSNTQPGRADGGINGARAAMRAWSDDVSSNIIYRYGGTTLLPQHVGSSFPADGVNGITFEDPSAEVTGSVSPSGGVLGLGGTWVNGNRSTIYGEQMWYIAEGNVVLNDGLSTWTGLNTPRFDQLFAHELGHTMGWRHSDLGPGDIACPAGYPCDPNAIMKASMTTQYGAVLQPWDKDAVRTVYGGADNFSFDSDFDGDGKSDKAVFRPESRQWWILRSQDSGVVTTTWGLDGDVPVAADYDGDGKADITVWRPSNGTWWVRKSTDLGVINVGWGFSTDLPVPGDYDGDLKADFAIFRPSDNSWWILKSTTSYTGYSVFYWGQAGDKPVQADYDGDGKTDVAVWRPADGTWWVLKSSTLTGIFAGWGYPDDIPVPGYYDADNKADYAIWRPSARQFWVLNSTGGHQVHVWGLEGDRPVVGDYNGDGRSDFVVWRPSNGTWWFVNSNDLAQSFAGWGLRGDTPVHHVIGR